MQDNQGVKDFVVNSLGCNCSEDVFSYIKNEKNVEVNGVKIKNKINIGNRLLVYIVGGGPAILDEIPALISAGRKERDGHSFNRFRLVIVTDDEKLKKEILKRFINVPDADEKVHLHVIKSDKLAHI